MILQEGERGITYESVEILYGQTWVPGNLQLTNCRLVFEGQFFEAGVGTAPRTLLDLQLGFITNAVALPGRHGVGTLRIEAGRGYIYTFRTSNAAGWVDAIVKAKSEGPRIPPPVSPSASKEQIIVNVQQAPAPPTVFLHCRHCGSLVAAGSVHCTSCGASL